MATRESDTDQFPGQCRLLHIEIVVEAQPHELGIRELVQERAPFVELVENLRAVIVLLQNVENERLVEQQNRVIRIDLVDGFQTRTQLVGN